MLARLAQPKLAPIVYVSKGDRLMLYNSFARFILSAALLLAVIAGALQWVPTHAANTVNPTLSLEIPANVVVNQQTTISVKLDGDLADAGNYFLCLDAGKGDGAQCSATSIAQNKTHSVVVTYTGSVPHTIKGWVNFGSGYYGGIAEVTNTVTPQPGNTVNTLYLPFIQREQITLGIMITPTPVRVGQESDILATMFGGSLGGDFRICIDAGKGDGANCAVAGSDVHAVSVTYTASVPHTIKVWVDALADGQWHFYPGVEMVTVTITPQ